MRAVKAVRDRRLRILSWVYRGLIICLVIMGLLLLGGTIYGVLYRQNPPNHKPVAASQGSGQGQTFTGIGRIRVSTADPQPGMVIIFVSFFYHPEDKAFSEELALRVKDFREIITGYIGSFSATQLEDKGEDDIKAELLRRFNAVLRLGQIETLYFSDFMIVG